VASRQWRMMGRGRNAVRLTQAAEAYLTLPAHTAMVAEFTALRGLAGVEIMTGDARITGLPSGSFDLV
jgi:hypothetical protein